MDPRRDFRTEWRKTILIAFSMLVFAPLAYLVIAHLMNGLHAAGQQGGETEILFYVLFVLSMVQPAAAFLITRFQVGRYRSLEAPRMTAGQLFTSLSIIRFALVEAAYIYGLVVFFVSGEIDRMYWFYPVGIAWSVVYWPRRASWERLVQALEAPS